MIVAILIMLRLTIQLDIYERELKELYSRPKDESTKLSLDLNVNYASLVSQERKLNENYIGYEVLNGQIKMIRTSEED